MKWHNKTQMAQVMHDAKFRILEEPYGKCMLNLDVVVKGENGEYHLAYDKQFDAYCGEVPAGQYTVFANGIQTGFRTYDFLGPLPDYEKTS